MAKFNLICTDIKGRIWLIEHVNIFNFWHKWLWNAFPSLYRHINGDGVFQPKPILKSFRWNLCRKILKKTAKKDK